MGLEGWTAAPLSSIASLPGMGQRPGAPDRGDSTFPVSRQHGDIGLEPLGGSEW